MERESGKPTSVWKAAIASNPLKATAFSLLLTGLLTQFPLVRNLDLLSYDLMFLIRGPQAPDEQVALLLIDEASLEFVGKPWPWPPEVFDTLIARLESLGVRLIVIDVLFDRPPQRLASPKVVAAGKFLFEERRAFRLVRFVAPEGASAVGFTNVPLDPDGFIRRFQAVRFHGRHPYFHLALVALARLLGKTPEVRGYTLSIGEHTIPLDHNYGGRIWFTGGADAFLSVSCAQVLDPEGFRLLQVFGTLKDRVVFLGSSLDEHHDFYYTPFFRMGRGKRRMVPGVQIEAEIFQTLRTGRVIRDAPLGISLLVWLILVGAGIAFSRLGGWGIGLYVLMGLPLLSLSYLVFLRKLLWISPLWPWLGGLFSLLWSVEEGFLRERREREKLRRLFGRYVSREVLSEILQNPEGVLLHGERRKVTVMVCDLRGFSRRAEQMPPEAVVDWLNGFLSHAVEVIRKHRGTVDKFEGDAVLAYFGAPVPDPQAPRRAFEAALELLEASSDYPVTVGLATGEVVVGNIGHPDRLEYTAIGDAVNLAHRLEQETESLGVDLLMDEETFQAIADGSPVAPDRFVSFPALTVHGRQTPVRVYGYRKEGGHGLH